MLRGGVVARRVVARGYDFGAAASKLTSAAARGELAALASANADATAKVAAASKTVAPIDWEHYKRTIKSNPSIVSELEKAYNSVQYSAYVNEMQGEIKAAFEKLSAEAKAAEQTSAARAKELAALLKSLEDNRIDALSTVDEYTALHPDVEAKTQEAIKKQEYYV